MWTSKGCPSIAPFTSPLGQSGVRSPASDDPAAASAYLNARNLLFPDALRVVRLSYSDEHGAAVEMEQRITPAIRQLLADTRVGDTTLAALYDQWVAAGKRLGELTKKRARARSSVKRSGTEPAPIDTAAARLAWVRTAQVFRTIVELLPLDADQRRALFDPLERDIERAQRARPRTPMTDPDPTGDADDLIDEAEDLDPADPFDDGADPMGDTPDVADDGDDAPEGDSDAFDEPVTLDEPV